MAEIELVPIERLLALERQLLSKLPVNQLCNDLRAVVKEAIAARRRETDLTERS